MSGGVPAGELLPCPFCDGPAVNVAGEYISCGAPAFLTCAGRSVRADAEDWNTRATPTPPTEGRDADVERVAEALWKATPYYDGTPWDHFSFRRYGGTSDTRELYLTMARAALQALGERP